MDGALAALHQAIDACDILEPIHVVVPTVGMREWLVEQVMRHDAKSFGVVMNAKFHFIGDLHRGLRPVVDDPWSTDRQVAKLLRILSGASSDHQGIQAFINTSGGVLPASDRLAKLFDRYLSRRPMMISHWESGRCSNASAAPLAEVDKWQFDVWSELRREIGLTPPLLGKPDGALLPKHLLVFGIETVDERTMATLLELSKYVTIEVIAIHPSPRLWGYWNSLYPKNIDQVDVPRPRILAEVPSELADQQLVVPYRWLRAAEEMQSTLARGGIELPLVSSEPRAPQNRLERLQHGIAYGVSSNVGNTEADRSIVLHRCHGLARQAEVVFDAIVQALNDSAEHDPADKQLQLHEIAIVSPNIKRIAPHLRAAFDRKIVLSNRSECRLPMRLADLSLGDADDGARVFTMFLSVVGGRLDLDSVLDLLSDPALVESRKLGSEAIQRWSLHLTRANQRWGLDATHREAGFGVKLTVEGQPDLQHSWIHSLRRILLGAAVERGGAEVLLNHGVIQDVETDELDDVLELVELIEAIGSVASERYTRKTAVEWAELLEVAFSRICGLHSDLTPVPFRELQRLASFADDATLLDVLLTFDEVSQFLTAQFGIISDRRVVRSGEILASGLAVQNHVPYRVLCLVGVDDAAIPSGGRDGFDLASRENFVGDPDAKHDVRRQLMSSILSASDRVIITCDGRDLKNNEARNLAAPLDEFVAWRRESGDPIDEVFHPRHLYSPRNFLPHGVYGELPWSFDEASRLIAESMQSSTDAPAESYEATNGQSLRPQITQISLRNLGDMLLFPVSVFLRWSYNIFGARRGSDWNSTLIDLELENEALEGLAQRLFAARTRVAHSLVNSEDGTASKHWSEENRRLHLLPVTDSAKEVTEKMVSEVVQWAVEEWSLLGTPNFTEFEAHRLELSGDSIVIEGDVPTHDTSIVVMAQFDGRSPDTEAFRDRLMLHLIFYRACGFAVDKIQLIAMTCRFDEFVSMKNPCGTFEIGWFDGSAPTVDEAQKWLAALVGLYRHAAEEPIPTFVPRMNEPQSKTVGHLLYLERDVAKAQKHFEAEVAKKPTEFSKGFGGTNEAIVFGIDPKFQECFPVTKSPDEPLPSAEEFWLDRSKWWPRPDWVGKSGFAGVADVRIPDVLGPNSSDVGGGAA